MPHPLKDLSPRKRKYAELVASGLSKKDAAIQSGYSPNTATSVIETSDYKTAFQNYLRSKIPASKIAKRIKEGMDAVSTEFFAVNGKVTDSRDTINYSERRQYTTLAAQMAGYYTPKQEFDHTQRIDENQLRRLMDIADKLNLASIPAERIKQLEESHVPLNRDEPEVIDAEIIAE